jgi:hypothetical protein
MQMTSGPLPVHCTTAKRPSTTESDRRRHAVCLSQIGSVRHGGRPDVVLIGDATNRWPRPGHCPRAPLVVGSPVRTGHRTGMHPLRRRRSDCGSSRKRTPKMAHLKVFDSIEPCPSCGSKKFRVLFRDGSDMPERQVNERCDDCGDERLAGWQRP